MSKLSIKIPKYLYTYLCTGSLPAKLKRHVNLLIPVACDSLGIDCLYSWKTGATLVVWVWPWKRRAGERWIDLNFECGTLTLYGIQQLTEGFEEYLRERGEDEETITR